MRGEPAAFDLLFDNFSLISKMPAFKCSAGESALFWLRLSDIWRTGTSLTFLDSLAE